MDEDEELDELFSFKGPTTTTTTTDINSTTSIAGGMNGSDDEILKFLDSSPQTQSKSQTQMETDSEKSKEELALKHDSSSRDFLDWLDEDSSSKKEERTETPRSGSSKEVFDLTPTPPSRKESFDFNNESEATIAIIPKDDEVVVPEDVEEELKQNFLKDLTLKKEDRAFYYSKLVCNKTLQQLETSSSSTSTNSSTQNSILTEFLREEVFFKESLSVNFVNDYLIRKRIPLLMSNSIDDGCEKLTDLFCLLANYHLPLLVKHLDRVVENWYKTDMIKNMLLYPPLVVEIWDLFITLENSCVLFFILLALLDANSELLLVNTSKEDVIQVFKSFSLTTTTNEFYNSIKVLMQSTPESFINELRNNPNNSDIPYLLKVFYETHNPEKLNTMEEVLTIFDGRYEVLNQKLKNKYSIGLGESNTDSTCVQITSDEFLNEFLYKKLDLKFYLIDARPHELQLKQGRFPISSTFPINEDEIESLRGCVHIVVMGEGLSHLNQLFKYDLSPEEVILAKEDETRTSTVSLNLISKGFPFVSILKGGFASCFAWLSRCHKTDILVDYDSSTSLLAALEFAHQEEIKYQTLSRTKKTAISMQKFLDSSMTKLTLTQHRIEHAILEGQAEQTTSSSFKNFFTFKNQNENQNQNGNPKKSVSNFLEKHLKIDDIPKYDGDVGDKDDDGNDGIHDSDDHIGDDGANDGVDSDGVGKIDKAPKMENSNKLSTLGIWKRIHPIEGKEETEKEKEGKKDANVKPFWKNQKFFSKKTSEQSQDDHDKNESKNIGNMSGKIGNKFLDRYKFLEPVEKPAENTSILDRIHLPKKNHL